MIVIDTCVWIEALQKTPTGIHYKGLWNRPEEIIVPTAVQFEVYRWCLRNMDEHFAINAISGTRRCVVQPVSEEIALTAATIARPLRLAALDAIIYATAMIFEARVVTCDAHFAELPQADYQAKLLA